MCFRNFQFSRNFPEICLTYSYYLLKFLFWDVENHMTCWPHKWHKPFQNKTGKKPQELTNMFPYFSLHLVLLFFSSGTGRVWFFPFLVSACNPPSSLYFKCTVNEKCKAQMKWVKQHIRKTKNSLYKCKKQVLVFLFVAQVVQLNFSARTGLPFSTVKLHWDSLSHFLFGYCITLGVSAVCHVSKIFLVYESKV